MLPMFLSAEEHETYESWYTDVPPAGDGWTLIGWTALQAGPPPQNYDQGRVYLWVRRKDGRPLGSTTPTGPLLTHELHAAINNLLGVVDEILCSPLQSATPARQWNALTAAHKALDAMLDEVTP
jgi:hypothetical protein